MTPKEKAKELIDKFTFQCKECDYNWNAKQCALITVDEIINYLTTSLDVQTSLKAVDYWKQVKQEIEKL